MRYPDCNDSAPPPVQGIATMLWVRGKRFTCQCGCNVFTKRADETYACNVCSREYAGTPVSGVDK